MGGSENAGLGKISEERQERIVDLGTEESFRSMLDALFVGRETIVEYADFLARKSHWGENAGFEPSFLPESLFDFQRALVEWATKKGRAAIFADCGTGKSVIELVWAENIIRKTNKPVLIVTPLAVSYQMIREGEKFQIECVRSSDGIIPSRKKLIVTNYERLHLFNSSDFAALVCDESGAIKNFDGVRRKIVTEFMKKLPYRLLATATAAPNDYIELGTSSEALGELGYMDMLSRFFINDHNTNQNRRMHGKAMQWRFKGHAEHPFWQWVCSWARAMRKPSDLGFDDRQFILPPLVEETHVVKKKRPRTGMLFDLPAIGLAEERIERRDSIQERCEKMAELVNHQEQALVWCHLNPEGDLLTKLIKGAVQVKGSDSDEEKEERLLAFADKKIRALVTKPKIGAWGLNFQSCAHVASFATHSYEQDYQGIRRCWRFGQKRPVKVDRIVSEGEINLFKNLTRKAKQADAMFDALVAYMNNAVQVQKKTDVSQDVVVPSWL